MDDVQNIIDRILQEEEELDLLDEIDPHAARREAQQERERRGMVKHSPPNVRPRRAPKPRITFR